LVTLFGYGLLVWRILMYKPFTSTDDSHAHSLHTLEELYGFNDFMESIGSVIDLGCGTGNDLVWWATRTTDDDTNTPLNIRCVGIDTNANFSGTKPYPNISCSDMDFEEKLHVNNSFDILWSHDAFQYAINPVATLTSWYDIATENAMLILIVPQTTNIMYNQEHYDQQNYQYYNHTLVSLIHMLAVSGWDCSDGFFKKDHTTPWLHAVVYKGKHKPMNPRTTSWYNLVELNVLPESAVASINTYGYLRQQDLVLPWITGSYTKY
jgi:SAM-dependent methyltransferase